MTTIPTAGPETQICTVEGLEERLIESRVVVQIQVYVNKGWRRVRKNVCVIFMQALFVIALVIIREVIIQAAGFNTSGSYGGYGGLYASLIDGAFNAFILTPLQAGTFKTIMNSMMQEDSKMRFSDLFWAFHAWFYCRFMLMTFLVTFLVRLGYIFFIIPGIILSLMFFFWVPIFMEAPHFNMCKVLSESGRLFGKYWCSIILFCLYSFVIIILGICALVVGVFLAWPVVLCAYIEFYRHIAGINGLPREEKSVPLLPNSVVPEGAPVTRGGDNA